MANATSDIFVSVTTPSKCDSLKDETRQAPGKRSPILQIIPGLRMQMDVDADMERKWKSLPRLAVKLPLWCPGAKGAFISTKTK